MYIHTCIYIYIYLLVCIYLYMHTYIYMYRSLHVMRKWKIEFVSLRACVRARRSCVRFLPVGVSSRQRAGRGVGVSCRAVSPPADLQIPDQPLAGLIGIYTIMHTHIYIYIYMQSYMCIYIYIYISMSRYIYIFKYKYMHV